MGEEIQRLIYLRLRNKRMVSKTATFLTVRIRPKCSFTEIASVGVCTYTSSWVMDNFIFYFGGAQWEKDVVSNEVFVFDTGMIQ